MFVEKFTILKFQFLHFHLLKFTTELISFDLYKNLYFPVNHITGSCAGERRVRFCPVYMRDKK